MRGSVHDTSTRSGSDSRSLLGRFDFQNIALVQCGLTILEYGMTIQQFRLRNHEYGPNSEDSLLRRREVWAIRSEDSWKLSHVVSLIASKDSAIRSEDPWVLCEYGARRIKPFCWASFRQYGFRQYGVRIQHFRASFQQYGARIQHFRASFRQYGARIQHFRASFRQAIPPPRSKDTALRSEDSATQGKVSWVQSATDTAIRNEDAAILRTYQFRVMTGRLGRTSCCISYPFFILHCSLGITWILAAWLVGLRYVQHWC